MSDKRLLKRCGGRESYLIETDLSQSDLRVCASGEPKLWLTDLGRWCQRDQRKPETFFQRLSHRASEYKELRLQVNWNWCHLPREMRTSAWKTLRPGIPTCRGKGQPEGSAVTGKTRKPWVAEYDHVSEYAAGHNNSNLTPQSALAGSGEWELILTNSSHYCFIYLCLTQYTSGWHIQGSRVS